MLNRLFRSVLKRRTPGLANTRPLSAPLLEKLKSGYAAHGQGDFAKGLQIAHELSRELPQHPDIIMLECVCLVGLEQFDLALPRLKNLVRDHPTSANAWKVLGVAAEKTAQHELMLDCYRESLAIDPQQVELETALGVFLTKRRRYQEARLHFDRAIDIAPTAIGYQNLGSLLQISGRPDLAYEAVRHALRLDPNMDNAYRGITSTLLYLINNPGQSDKEIYAGYTASVRRTLASEQPTNFTLTAHSGRIKIGYVSSDFRQHPVSRNMLPILALHDRLQYEIHAYVDIEEADEYTAHCQRHIERWHDIHGMTDREVAQQIFDDRIDVLVILAGHFDGNRPNLCMYGCAPVNISYHDASTSGLDNMDYLITDITMSPKDTQEWFSERLIHLPTFYLHDPIDDAPEITALPAHVGGNITFGSCNNPAKLNLSVFLLWARVLAAVPGSRLVLKYFDRFNDPDVREYCLEAFRDNGIESTRIEFLDDLNDRASHLKVYQQIDIALDPFPFTGSTTTFEALWMGVPVITMAGATMVGRWSSSMLRRIGHPDWIAHNVDEYIAISQRLASDHDQLEKFRFSLRAKVLQSPLCDANRRTRQLEKIYRFTIGKWRAQHASLASKIADRQIIPSLDLEQEMGQLLTLAAAGKSGPTAEALEKLFYRLGKLTTNGAEILNELAVALIGQAELFLASQVLNFVQKHMPDIPSVLCNLGIINAQIGQYKEALRFFARALEFAPRHISSLFNYAVALTQLERYEEAKHLLNQLLTLQPEHLGAHLQLAEILRESGDIRHAVDYAQRAVALAPGEPNALNSLGNMLRDAGQMDQAIACFTEALAIQPTLATAKLGLAFVHLIQENFTEGWPLYEARKTAFESTKRLIYFPEWEGEVLRDKVVLIYGEQGIGDDLMFASCYADIIEQAGRVVVDCEPRLRELYTRSFPQALVVTSPRWGVPTWMSKIPKIDSQIAAGSLPRHFRSTRAQFPHHDGYLKADPLRIEAWREKLDRIGPGLKIGIAWKGGLGKTRAAVRSIALSNWQPLFSLSNCRFISLQQGKASAEIEAIAAKGYEISYWEEAIADINETAALISALDLVISVCSTVVHLTGALGKPVWILSPPVPEWRYTLTATHMAWYPNSKIFRAKTENQWQDTINSVADCLAQRQSKI